MPANNKQRKHVLNQKVQLWKLNKIFNFSENQILYQPLFKTKLVHLKKKFMECLKMHFKKILAYKNNNLKLENLNKNDI